MKTLLVCCALITIPSKQGPLLLAAKKPAQGDHASLYEFPGGKLESGENAQDAVIREIREELACTVVPIGELQAVDYHRSEELTIRLLPILCRLEGTTVPIPLEHEHIGFFTTETLLNLPWAPADRRILTDWIDKEKPNGSHSS